MSEITVLQGNITKSADKKIAIVASRFNATIVDILLHDALETFMRHAVEEKNITVVRVPGAFEIPLVAAKLAKNHAVVIALGAVIRGETPHFDYVCQACVEGVNGVMQSTGTPVVFGVLTTNTVEQALARAHGETVPSSKASQGGGVAAAEAALELIDLHRQLDEGII